VGSAFGNIVCVQFATSVIVLCETLVMLSLVKNNKITKSINLQIKHFRLPFLAPHISCFSATKPQFLFRYSSTAGLVTKLL
jgi:hypothetical protein